MPEHATAVAEQSAVGPLAAVLGREILNAMLVQVRSQPDHWHRMNEITQKQQIDKLREATRVIVHNAVRVLVSGAQYKAVPCKLEQLTFKDGIKGQFALVSHAEGRHELADAIGKNALIVLADADAYTERMDDIRETADQMDWISGDYRPAEDRLTPAPGGLQSWSDLMGKLKGGLITKEQAEAEFGGPLPETPPTVIGVDPAKPGDDETADPLDFLDNIVGPQSIKAEDLPWDQFTLTTAGEAIDLPEVYELGNGETLRQYFLRMHPGCTLAAVDQPLVFGSANDKIDEAAKLADLLERLYGIGMTISLGTLQTFTPEQIEVTRVWLNEYLKTPEGEQCRIARPHWLPLPDPGNIGGAAENKPQE